MRHRAHMIRTPRRGDEPFQLRGHDDPWHRASWCVSFGRPSSSSASRQRLGRFSESVACVV